MENSSDKVMVFLKTKLVRERAFLYDRPVEHRKLIELREEDTVFEMVSGRQLIVRGEDIKKLKELLPHYLHDKIVLPILLELIDTCPIRLRIKGNKWQYRSIKMMLHGRMKWKEDDVLSETEFRKLLRIAPSVVHVMLKETSEEGSV